MSKILRRPMFRGGPVDSRGTGITSGLMDTPSYNTGGRVGLFNGGTPTGAEVKAMAEKNIFGVPALRDLTRSTNFINDLGYNYLLRPAANVANLGTNYILGTDFPMVKKRDSNEFYDNLVQKEATKLSNELIPQVDEEDEYEESYSDITEKNQTKKRQETENKELQKKLNPNDPNNNNEQKVEMSAKDLIAENAELFKELLGEGDKKKLKDARISDASDYLLKFFEGSQKEGATVGSSAADVAAFATSKDSKTEKAKAQIEKGDQTAVALAINDYIAGKRSAENIEQLIARSDLALENKVAILQMAKEDLAANIVDAGKGGSIGTQKLIDGIKNTPRLRGKGIEQFSSEKGEAVEYESGYENKVFIDTDTETIFTFDKSGNKLPLY